MDYYEDAAGPQLADEFYEELLAFFGKAADTPEAYAIRERDLRRANLERFPYHFLFRVAGDAVRILVVRHHSRRPSLGTHRR
jgi:plasmid stabilization system protein ParE